MTEQSPPSSASRDRAAPEPSPSGTPGPQDEESTQGLGGGVHPGGGSAHVGGGGLDQAAVAGSSGYGGAYLAPLPFSGQLPDDLPVPLCGQPQYGQFAQHGQLAEYDQNREYGQLPPYGQTPQYGPIPAIGHGQQVGFAAPGYGEQPYGQPSYPQGSYGQESHPQGSYGQQSFGPAYPPPAYGPWLSAQPGYLVPGYGQPGYGQLAPRNDYASWGKRVGAYLIDFLPALVAQALMLVGYGIFVVDRVQSAGTGSPAPTAPGVVPMVIGFVLTLAALGWQIYNRWIVAGRTGQSLGKRILKIRLLSEETNQPIGPLNAFLRDLVHVVDGLAYVGYLWPLWDEKRQTLADKLMQTVVVDLANLTA